MAGKRRRKSRKKIRYLEDELETALNPIEITENPNPNPTGIEFNPIRIAPNINPNPIGIAPNLNPNPIGIAPNLNPNPIAIAENLNPNPIGIAVFPEPKILQLMRSMGYRDGAGLGKNEDGILEPIEVVVRKGKLGIGAEKTLKIRNEREDIQFVPAIGSNLDLEKKANIFIGVNLVLQPNLGTLIEKWKEELTSESFSTLMEKIFEYAVLEPNLGFWDSKQPKLLIEFITRATTEYYFQSWVIDSVIDMLVLPTLLNDLEFWNPIQDVYPFPLRVIPWIKILPPTHMRILNESVIAKFREELETEKHWEILLCEYRYWRDVNVAGYEVIKSMFQDRKSRETD